MSTYGAFSADGHEAVWRTWDGEAQETLTLRWENEAWTATGDVGRERITYVVRLSPTWQVRQFLLFRDLEEPDLWLATDGRSRWGEMNGAHRTELDGCIDVGLACSPFTHSLPIRRLPLDVGDAAELPIATIDVETLAVVPVTHRYRRLASHRWSVTAEGGQPATFDVDAHGLVVDLPTRFRRHPPPNRPEPPDLS